MLVLNNMNFNDYKESCLKFAEDTKDWSALDNNFYTTIDNGDWAETSDNGHGGFDLNWCFKLDKEEIENKCMAKYLEQLKEHIEVVYDNEEVVDEWSKEDMQQYLGWIRDCLDIN
ncbi:MAG: hypothetical protein ACOCRX_05340 [Candidatus Woesearchaeota archaeon]